MQLLDFLLLLLSDLEFLEQGVLLALLLITGGVLGVAMTAGISPAQYFIPPTSPDTEMLSHHHVFRVLTDCHRLSRPLLDLPVSGELHVPFT